MSMLKKLLSSVTGQILIVLLGLAIVSACSNLDTQANPKPAMSVAGTQWELHKLGKDTLTLAPPISINFDSDRVAGYSGCNRYFASYTASGDGVFGVGPIGATKMACMGEGGQLEQRYFEELGKANQYCIILNQLHLMDAKRNVLMVFNVAKTETGNNK